MKEIIFTWCSGLIVCFVSFPICAQDPVEVIRQAGNTEDEKERYLLLAKLNEQRNLDAQLRADLELVLPIVDRWANGREKFWNQEEKLRAAENGYLCDFLKPTLQSFDINPDQIPKESLLYPIWVMYIGRILIQLPIQIGKLYHNKGYRTQFYGRGREMLKLAGDVFPENQIIKMYLGEPIVWPRINLIDPKAPDWANYQREALEKLSHIIYFWIDERQASDGQFGGGWGDDVEIWRHWATLLIGFNDPKVNAAQTKISNGLFALSRMKGGYTSLMSDVEHTSEDSGDTGTAMLHVAPDDSIWQARAIRLAELMESLWTGWNERGMLQFKSTYFTSKKVNPNPNLACDTVYHPRSVQPTLLYWQRTGDPKMTRLFKFWMDTWVDAAARSEFGKPAGILPTAIHWPDGRVGGLSNNWWDPRNHSEFKLYQWPSAMNMMTNMMLLTFFMTKEKKYLEPIRSMAVIRKAYLVNSVNEPKPGSTEWCASKMGFLKDTVGKYRLLTSDEQFDDLLKKEASGYVRFRITGNRRALIQDLKYTADGFGYDCAAYTKEVRWTDRIMDFHSRYLMKYMDKPMPRPNLNLLYNSVTGDFGNPMYFPMNAVRWETVPHHIATLVTDHDTEGLKAELYHFGASKRMMGATFYLLKEGYYKWTLETEGKKNSKGIFRMEYGGKQINFTLPPRKLCVLEIQKTR